MSDLEKLETGGTDFDQVLTSVFGDPKQIKGAEQGGAVLVVYTDGYCSISFPRGKVRGQVIWLMTEDGSNSYIKTWDPNARVIRLEGKTR